jgi:uncharacterized protein YdcH (DUF465 family)
MTIEHHKFAKEFPEFREHIHELKIKDPAFAALVKEYDEIDDEVYRIEQEIETPSDAYTEALKTKRVGLKDKLFALVSAYAP